MRVCACLVAREEWAMEAVFKQAKIARALKRADAEENDRNSSTVRARPLEIVLI